MRFLRDFPSVPRAVLLCALLIAATPHKGSTLAQQRATTEDFMGQMNNAMADMDRSMSSAPMNGNADHDFASMMIPHHKGAIEMAKSELLFGKDPTMRRLAQEILVDQESEVEAMNLWLKKHHDPTDKERKK
jgi:uncharacterized protein (DUF305 family)